MCKGVQPVQRWGGFDEPPGGLLVLGTVAGGVVVPGVVVVVGLLVPEEGMVLPGTHGLATVADVPLGCEAPVPAVVEAPMPVAEVGPVLAVVEPVVVLLVPLALHGPVTVLIVAGEVLPIGVGEGAAWLGVVVLAPWLGVVIVLWLGVVVVLWLGVVVVVCDGVAPVTGGVLDWVAPGIPWAGAGDPAVLAPGAVVVVVPVPAGLPVVWAAASPSIAVKANDIHKLFRVKIAPPRGPAGRFCK
ncbi:MAG TPA: hypothetical protein VLT16_16010 [Candidatus Limnocylindrales bacterium]|nr:hypothetical protein [Candidatus Limnocylindrales bacterium]